MARIAWTRLSRADLAAIRAYIARDAPRTADAFVKRIIKAVDRLKRFPQSGSIVPEAKGKDIREILFGSYRIVYRVVGARVEILTVRHGARRFDDDILP
jgi:toxin ParE1/3/4